MTHLQIRRRPSVRRGGLVAAFVTGLLSLQSIGCSSPTDERPGEPEEGSPPEALFELDGQDLLVTIPGDDTRQARVKHLPPVLDGELYLDSDESLRVEGDGITIEDLQALAREVPGDARYRELLVRIFNEYGVSMSYLPRGFSAGLGAAIDLADEVDASDVLEHLTGNIWYGKYFERPGQCLRLTRGANRIGDHLRIDFVARLLPRDQIERFVASADSLDIRARSNYVDLNYASAMAQMRRTSLQEPHAYTEDTFPVLRRMAGLVERLGVYDLGVVIPGRHGPVLVGRTWLGEYADNAEQTYSAASLDGRQIAWFFLDFNEGAIESQAAPSDRRVAYTSKSSCERRALTSEADELPAPRPL